MSTIKEVAQLVETGKVKQIEAAVQSALDAGLAPNDILNEGMIGAMSVVGAKFQANEIFVPEMLVAAKTMKKGVEVLKPHLAGDAVGKNGKYIIGTVAGDLHDIGKNLVALMIESAGFEVIDLGVDVPAEKFVEAIKANPDCKVVGASALLTTTMDSLKNTVKTMIDAGCKDQVKIMVGGAPITQAFADEIGADAYTPDAGAAAVKAVELATA
ncbi:MAG: corrinoid protein [Oscillospiraceae bacterium]|jgi:corrinoid protein of di/trimethylamine methyltransferase|nr:corrinoid protein [Oscillospiraceae bacterium]